MATTTTPAPTTANTQFLPRTTPVITTIARDTIIAQDENDFFETESASSHLGRSPVRSALALMWEAVDERVSADKEYASLIRASESQGASCVVPTFPVSSLLSAIRITSCDELIF